MSRRLKMILSVCALMLGLLPLAAPQGLAQERPEYSIVDPAFEASEGATAFSGTLTSAAGDHAYQIEVPDDWNGTLVLYAHGFVGPQNPELVVQQPPLRPLFIGQGFAWAASSYSSNGYVIDSSVDEMEQLRTEFATLTGLDAPTATIFTGFSMGGHITGVATERYPDSYVGAMPACGVMADQDLFDYFTDVNLVGGTLAGVPVPTPGDLSYLGGTAQTISAILGLQSGLTPAGVQYADVVEDLSGGERPTFEESFEFWNVLAAVDPGEGPTIPFLQALYGRALSGGIEDPVGLINSYDNSGTTYAFPNAVDGVASPEAAALNAAITRLSNTDAPPFPTIEGTPAMPVMSLHTSGDLFVPMFNQQVYAQEVADNGLSDNLVQRVVRAAGHCDFTGEELGAAFVDLLGWIATGTAPAGDDLLDDAVVSDRGFGCAWTSEDRPLMPPCPGDTVDVVAADDGDAVDAGIAVSVFREQADSVIVARADDFADGLTGSSLAGAIDAPLLLNPQDVLDQRVLAEIQRLGAGEVVLLGGEAALSAEVAGALADAGLTVTRVAGENRYSTAAAVATAVSGIVGLPDEVFLANAGNPADAVGAAGLAAFLGQPILLVDAERVSGETSDTLEALGDPAVTVLGGSEAVGDAIAGDSPRLAGDTRYGTSAAIVTRSRAAGMRINAPLLADGETFAGALVAGPAAANAGQILVTVDADDLAGSAETTELLTSLAGVVDSLLLSDAARFGDASIAALTAAVTPASG